MCFLRLLQENANVVDLVYCHAPYTACYTEGLPSGRAYSVQQG
jgi:hypothetical protein